VHAQESKSTPTKPVFPDIEIGSVDTKKVDKRNSDSSTDSANSSCRVPFLGGKSKTIFPATIVYSDLPRTIWGKISGLFSVIWMSAVFVFFVGMPVSLIFTYAFNHDARPLMALTKLIAALLLNFSAFNRALDDLYSGSTSRSPEVVAERLALKAKAAVEALSRS